MLNSNQEKKPDHPVNKTPADKEVPKKGASWARGGRPDFRPGREGEEGQVFIEKVLFINRTTKVTKGGKNLGFAALVVVGDGESRAGYALGKANEVADAIRKGIGKARKELVTIKKKGATIPHQIIGEFGAVEIMLKPAAKGTGVIASSPVRAICECAGIKDILTKNLGNSTNQINVVKATFDGLQNLKG